MKPTGRLVTGGNGVIVARHLVAERGAGRTRCRTDRSRRHRQVVGREVTGCAAVQGLLAGISTDAPLSVVIHTAGAPDDGTLGTLSAAQTTRVLEPKPGAALHLHELTRALDLSAFVLFSRPRRRRSADQGRATTTPRSDRGQAGPGPDRSGSGPVLLSCPLIAAASNTFCFRAPPSASEARNVTCASDSCPTLPITSCRLRPSGWLVSFMASA
ncbi:KR domain-containing protein [Streptomyces sp. NRRL WC-3549]|uniref:KR domain-containing protein n=1 Tax=Streptomyces sp. NRRL WC-3549 TaxID=1463925 RepID=UPI0004CAF7BB|nr:KR domain-containing protein [Streptomyces sp. NRRL WC-3549]